MMQKFSMYEKERERNKAILTLKELFTDLSVHNRDKVGTTQRLRSSGAFKGPNFPPPFYFFLLCVAIKVSLYEQEKKSQSA